MNNSASILLVDDSKSVRMYMRVLLEGMGHSVVEAGDGLQGLKNFEFNLPDMIITDLQMPEMDGLTFISEVRNRSPHVPVIVISSRDSSHEIIEAIRLGAWDYLVKPLKDEYEIEITIKRTLERGRLLKENRRYQAHLEEMVQAYTRDLRESNQRYKRLLESLTSYVYTVTFANDGTVKTVHSPGCEKVTGYSTDEFSSIKYLWYRILLEDDRPHVLNMVERVMTEHDNQSLEHRIRHKDGTIRWVSNTLVPCRAGGVLLSYDGIVSDITERKSAEEKLMASEERYRIVSEQTGQVVYDLDVNSGLIYWTGDIERVTGFRDDEFQAINVDCWEARLHPDDRCTAMALFDEALRNVTAYRTEYRFQKKDGEYVYMEDHGIFVAGEGGTPCRMLGTMEDISYRKNAEEALRASEAKLRLQFDRMPIGCIGFDADFRVTSWNPAAEQIFGYSSDEIMGKQPYRFLVPEDTWGHVDSVLKRLRDGENVIKCENRNLTKDGREIVCAWNNNLMCADDGAPIGFLAMCQDITEQMESEKKIKHHMDNLAALGTIDTAINSSLDLRITLNVLLHETLKQLRVDASSVLLLDPHSQMLEYKAGIGFNTNRISSARVRLGESYAGRVARERKSLIIGDIVSGADQSAPIALIDSEEFRAYVGIPLVAKGQVKGVLEIFHRAPLETDDGWLGFVETFANQAAIALDNADMFDNLQNSHSELLLAYDTTIEGWSRALDYRDKETEGHSRRVTDMAVRIAREMGIGKDKLIHVRRGALLHDIGKLGVPDSILLKPGSLTDEEFAIMKRHTEIAFSILSPIEFLRPAMDIPYYHHEKWDGSGYPRGLRGDEIPLAARIFAYVDVWDALLSDRPYRPAWPLERVLEHIRSQLGRHFDPNIWDVIERVMFSDPGR